MDVLSDLLHRARARHALIRQLIQRPPWSMTFADAPVLTVVATLGGHASVRLHDSDAAPAHLSPGDIALISKTSRYTIADHPSTPPQVVVQGGRKHVIGGRTEGARAHRSLAPRTYGDGLPGATTMLRGAYDLRGDVGDRLLDMLPPLAVVPAGPRTSAALDLLATEVSHEEPGQDAVLHQLLDLVLVLALRAWCAEPQTELPSWYRALTAPAIGDALRHLHEEPARRWTVAELAAKVGMSRATFAARFTSLVGEPPLTYLTGWRMTLGADLLRDTEATVAAVAREVGYEDAFAFSAAFKRARGVSPSVWRRRADAARNDTRTAPSAQQAPRVLIASDKFKGSLTAVQVAERVTTGLRRVVPGLEVDSLPVADGGEGTVDAAVTAGFERREVRVAGPLGQEVTAAFALRGATAVVEMAEASGLQRLPAGVLAPLTASTYGTGELLRAALDAGARVIVFGAGGSATTDGGAGMLSALGARFLDAQGEPVAPGGRGLEALARADLSGLDPRLASVDLVLASDVDNPLTGSRGAAAVYGPQKGASPDDVAVLDAALGHYARVLEEAVGPAAERYAAAPGAGAAGGVGYGALLLGARFRPGIEVMLDVLGFAPALGRASLVITGEGSLDEQTLHGKAPAGVAEVARAAGKPVVAVCGRLALRPEALVRAGIRQAYPLTQVEPDVATCIAKAGPILEQVAERIARDHLG